MEKDIQKNSTGRAWLITIVVILAGIISSAGKYKLAGTMTTIIPALGITKADGGWLMSICSVMGIVLALPAGGIMVKTGPKKLGLVALGCGLIGNVIGSLSNGFSLLLFSRLIEGISIGLIGVVAPTIIAAWFPSEKRGLPMAIWSLWIGLGLLFILNATNYILPPFGWHGVWWFSTLLFLVITVLFALIVKMPESTGSASEKANAPKVPLSAGMKSPSTWAVAMVMLVLGFSVGTVQTYTPAYIQEALKVTKEVANTYTSVFALGNIFGGIAMGFVLNKVKNRSLVLLVSTILVAIVMAFAFEFSLNSALIFMLVTGIIYQMVPASIFAVAPETASSPQTVGIAMGIIIIGQNVGAFFGPPKVGALVQAGGWHAAQFPLIVMGIVGIVAAILFYMLMKRKSAANA
ncbi:MFS transporter [Desulfitobacterium sp. AusDCA]|uniref:MFS transporter n=1 Tax=Desulfitobacterium sp. AusDCA TaxID=3240383 RepID=UPI003DA76B68